MYPIIPKDYKISTALNAYKTKDFIWDGPCNYPILLLSMQPHTDSIKYLIYNTHKKKPL